MNCLSKKRFVKSKEELTKETEKQFYKMFNDKSSELYQTVSNDATAQVLAVMFCVLDKEFGFGKEDLLKLKEGTETMFKLMLNNGICGQEFTTQNCLDYIKDNFDIDLGSVKTNVI